MRCISQKKFNILCNVVQSRAPRPDPIPSLCCTQRVINLPSAPHSRPLATGARLCGCQLHGKPKISWIKPTCAGAHTVDWRWAARRCRACAQWGSRHNQGPGLLCEDGASLFCVMPGFWGSHPFSSKKLMDPGRQVIPLVRGKHI